MSNAQVGDAQTLLFVPGTRPDRFAKAAASGCDAVVIDLEDAVPTADKELARSSVRDWLTAGSHAYVRVNSRSTSWFDEDLDAVRDHAAAVIIPKVESSRDVESARNVLGGHTAIIPIIESAAGVLHAAAICATPGVSRVAFGNGDLAAQLGVGFASWTALLHARSTVVLASAAAALPAPVDGVTTSLHDHHLLRRDARAAIELGFGGKFCIHPEQVATVRTAFTPTRRETDWATRIVQADTDGVVSVNGEMVDAPIIARARSILRRAGHTATHR